MELVRFIWPNVYFLYTKVTTLTEAEHKEKIQ